MKKGRKKVMTKAMGDEYIKKDVQYRCGDYLPYCFPYYFIRGCPFLIPPDFL